VVTRWLALAQVIIWVQFALMYLCYGKPLLVW